MINECYKTSANTLTLIVILIVFVCLSSCSSGPAARVSERSTQTVFRGQTHTVARGETLYSIAWRYGLDVKKLAYFNGINPPYTIFPSQKLRLNISAEGIQTLNSDSTLKNAKRDEVGSASNASISRSNNRSISEKKSSKSEISFSPLKWQWPAAGAPISLFQRDSVLDKGIDIGGNLGEPVLAAASGRVVYAGGGLSGYGNLLIIKHNEIFLSAYAHNSKLLVKEGDFIKGGQHIADMGSSGTDRVKLHFEIRSEGSPVDPLRYLPKR